MRLYDGVDVRVLSDQQLRQEYNAINEDDLDSFYSDKLGYLWFRVREVQYEMERRQIKTGHIRSFMGERKNDFNHWTPDFETIRSALKRVANDMVGHDRYGKPIKQAFIDTIVPIF